MISDIAFHMDHAGRTGSNALLRGAGTADGIDSGPGFCQNIGDLEADSAACAGDNSCFPFNSNSDILYFLLKNML